MSGHHRERRKGQLLHRHLCGPVGGDAGCEGRRGGVLLVLRVIGCDLALVLVEVKRGVKLGLFRNQFLETMLILKRSVELLLIFREGFLLPLDFLFLILCPAVQIAKYMLDALNCPNRIFGIKLRAVG